MIKVKTRNQEETTCFNCGKRLIFDSQDKKIGLGGYAVIKCPCCGDETPVSDERVVNSIFPTTFYHFGVGEGAVKLDNDDIQRLVDKVDSSLQKCDIGEFTFSGTGNTMVIGLRMADEDIIIVAPDYYEDSTYFDDVEE